MILATLASTDSPKHGRLAVVSSDRKKAVYPEVPLTLLHALENWKEVFPYLKQFKPSQGFDLDLNQCLAPLPFSHAFFDGSAFLSHVARARAARGDKMPESAKTTPLMYQGVSDFLLPWNAPIELINPAFGGDFEGEFGVILTDLRRGASPAEVERSVALLTLFNDTTYRELVKTELETKFGFLQSKPNSSFAPFVVTPDELGAAWKDGRVHLPLKVTFNGKHFGEPHGSEMNFSFYQLIQHANRTRPLSAGTILGCGTVSNEDAGRGFACLTEKRFQEILEHQKAITPWLKAGDRVEIEALQGEVSIFGKIEAKAI